MTIKKQMKERKKLNKFIIFLVLFSILLFSLSSVFVFANTNIQEQRVEQTLNNYYTAFAKKDMNEFISLRVANKNIESVKKITEKEWE